MDLTPYFAPADLAGSRLSNLARGVIGSEILKIATEIRSLQAKGATICNLTLGDFDPRAFPIPEHLRAGTEQALSQGHTNYPPSDGMLTLREAVVRFYERRLGVHYPVDSVLIAGGARPLIYGTFRTLVDPGDEVIYPVPSWNNDHYSYLCRARAIEVPVSAETNFFPTAAVLEPYLATARLIVLNSPLNPTGTVIAPEHLRAIAEAVVDENAHRATRPGTRPLYLLFDQVYWMLTFAGATHTTPVALVPAVAPYTIMLDAISKSFCATGLRVGWGLMPPAVLRRMADMLAHVGTWAPRAEQVATAALLDDEVGLRRFQEGLCGAVKERLDALYQGFSSLRQEGVAVEAIAPQGAIYLSVRFSWLGRSWRGVPLATNEDLRRLLLGEAGVAVVPFQAFGLKAESGWFRLSVGAVWVADIQAALPRIATVYRRLS